MKKNILLMLIALFCAMYAQAYDFKSGDLYYNITSRPYTLPFTVEVTYESGYDNYLGLKSVVIPESVTYDGRTYKVTRIGEGAFEGCSGFTSITIPNNITSIGDDAFKRCIGLTSIVWNSPSYRSYLHSSLPDNLPFYDIKDNITSITFGNEVDSIPDYLCYEMSNLTSITIPNHITSIGECAFSGCTGLTSVTIGNGVKSIGEETFSGCRGLTSITIPNGVTSIEYRTFYGCTGLISITIPNSVTSIGWSAFGGCTGLTSITIPNSVTSIGRKAFYDCTGLTSVTIPNSVTSIGDDAFHWCSGLTSIIIPNSVTSIGDGAFSRCTGLTSITIGNGVKSIERYAFSYCDGLTSIIIPNSVTSIGEGVFSACDSLTSIVIENGNTKYDSRDNCNAIIKTVTNTLVQGCKTTIIPNSVTSIGEKAFLGCSGLTSITIPNSVTSIGEKAFLDCSGLTSITIGNGVKSIGKETFSGCTNITSVVWNAKSCKDFDSSPFLYKTRTQMTSFTFGNEVESIPAYLCHQMSKLTSITIPGNVISIGDSAFYGCTGLTAISSLAGTPPTTQPHTFGEVRKYISIYIPCGTKRAYQVDKSWWQGFQSPTTINYVEELLYSLSVTTQDDTKGSVSVIKEATSCTDNSTVFEANANEHYHFVQWNDGNTDNPRTVLVGNNTTYTAEFAPNQYAVSATGEHGHIEGTGKYDYCTTVTLIVVANEHYHFTKWSDGNTDNPRTLVLTQDTTCIAEFAANDYTISAIPNMSEYGNVNGSGTYKYQSDVLLTAEANPQYHFLQWNDGNTNNPRTITVEKDETYTAIFVQDSCIITTKAEYGRVTGGGQYEYGTMVKLLVQPNAHYHFTQWTDGNTDNPRTVIVTQDTTLTAEFAINQYTIKTEAKHGTVSGGGRYDSGSSIMLTANPSNYYHFVQWNDGNTDNPRSIIVTQDTTFTAEFAPNRYTITASGEHGTVEGTGMYDYNTKVNLTAVPDKHYHFVKWSDGNTDNPRTVWIYQDITLTAEFAPNQYTITTYAQHGSVNGGGTYDYGTTATLTATADAHYHFTQWSDGNTDNPRTVSVEDNATYTAEFKPDSYTIIVSAGEHGNVSGAGTYDYGTTATLTATANEHYHFTQWTDGNTDNPRTVSVEGDATYTAEFLLNEYTITVLYDNIKGYVSGGGTYVYGTQVRLEVSANSGYEFAQWSNGATYNPYLLTATADLTLEAQFIPATAVDNVSADGTTPQKIVRDGQVYILRNGKTYTTTGVEVK